MATSRLEKIGTEARTETLAKNTYNDSDEYSAAHPNAKSPIGKEGIGNTADQTARKTQLSKNMFNSNNEYGPNNLY
jgi:hypothetical protein